MGDLYTQFDGVFFEKTRLSIMTLLFKEEQLSFNTLKELLGGTDGGIYTHLEKLRQSGYVEKVKEVVAGSVASQYSLTVAGRKAFKEYVEFLEKVLETHKRGL